MAITPNLAEGLSDAQSVTLARVIEEVDLWIQENYTSGQTLEVRTSLLLDIINDDPKVLDAFIATYEAAGWVIVKYKNKKQGSWLSFSAN